MAESHVKKSTTSRKSDLNDEKVLQVSKKDRLQYIDGIRREGTPETGYMWTILGRTTSAFQKIVYDSMTGDMINQSGLYGSGTCDVVGHSIRTKRAGSYDDEIDQLNKANLDDAAEGIDVYLESIDEVARRLSRRLVEVDTGKSNKYVVGTSFNELRASAKDLGANLLVNFRPAGEEILATPVKYAAEKIQK